MSMPVAVVQEFLASLAGLGLVSGLTFVFVLVARFLAGKLLGENDGSTEP